MASKLTSILVAALSALSLPAQPGVETSAQHLYIMDYDTGAVLVDKGGEEGIPTASKSKRLDADFVFEELKQGHPQLDTEFSVSEKAWRTQGSTMFVPINGRVKVE